jgi:hypothetical protein
MKEGRIEEQAVWTAAGRNRKQATRMEVEAGRTIKNRQ